MWSHCNLRTSLVYRGYLRKACEVIRGNNLPWLKDGAAARLLGDAPEYAKLFSTGQLQVLKKLINFFDARKVGRNTQVFLKLLQSTRGLGRWA